MPKRKGHFQKEAHFVAELPLDLCIQRLHELNDALLQITITRHTPDEAAFTVQVLDEAVVTAEGTGTLRRWQGTHTRVDCEMQIREGVWRWLASMTALTILSLTAVLLLIMGALQVGGVWLIWLLSAGSMGILGWLVLAQATLPLDDVPPSALRLIERVLTHERKQVALVHPPTDVHTEQIDGQPTALPDDAVSAQAYQAGSRSSELLG